MPKAVPEAAGRRTPRPDRASCGGADPPSAGAAPPHGSGDGEAGGPPPGPPPRRPSGGEAPRPPAPPSRAPAEAPGGAPNGAPGGIGGGIGGGHADPAPDRAAVRAEAERIRARFEAMGATPFETDVLQPAGPLLDLYGEDIRARAYVTHDPLLGERMLRPDFTVALVRAHLRGGPVPARYAYAGEVFRRQEVPGRPTEYLQAGIEILDVEAPWARDAEVFAAVLDVCQGAPSAAVTGDIGLLLAAVRGLKASARRRAMLVRHVWRPERFRALLERFGRGPSRAVPPEGAVAEAGPEIGARGAREVAARLAALREDAAEPPLPAGQIAALGALLALRGTAGAAPEPLRALARDLPALAPAADVLERRLDAMAARGLDPDAIAFEASFGRSTMEYYDGFVFALRDPAAPDAPPLASGGRYDALTRALGGGEGIPAVGAIVRPATLLAARAAASGRTVAQDAPGARARGPGA